MKILFSFLLFLCTSTLADAFLIPQPSSSSSTKSNSGSVGSNRIITIGKVPRLEESATEEDTGEDTKPPPMSKEDWLAQLATPVMQQVRIELMQKYIEQGEMSQEKAEIEVAVFLADQDQVEKYLEMRAYSTLQADDLLSTGLQLVGGFFLGFLGIVGPKYYAAMQSAQESGVVDAVSSSAAAAAADAM